MSSGSVTIPAGHTPRLGTAVPNRLCMWFTGGSNDMTGETLTIEYSCAVKFVEAHNFDATVISDGTVYVVLKINSKARMKDGNDDYNFSIDAVNPNDRPKYIGATVTGGANVTPVS